MMRSNQQDQLSKAFHELSVLVLNLLRSPQSPMSLSDQSSDVPRRRSSAPPPQISPAGFASLLLGISLALMLCGSLTFFIGFLLMPWVLGLVMVFYVVGVITTISMLGRSLLCYVLAPSSSGKEVPSWKLL
ncbi:uncharacterized protein [Euphorbia lathyris]|uniref:uncharacterized protein n=1 Tax=Euphorbia lathyris TaxID=212925 RepID=UPI003314159C